MRKMELGRSSCATPATDSGMTHSCLGTGVYHLAMCDPEGAAGMMDGRLGTVTNRWIRLRDRQNIAGRANSERGILHIQKFKAER